MLQPKRTKYRKNMRGRRKGVASTGSSVDFGEYGLKAMGTIGIKTWIYHGEILPPPPEEVEELETIEVTVQADSPDEIVVLEDDI